MSEHMNHFVRLNWTEMPEKEIGYLVHLPNIDRAEKFPKKYEFHEFQ